MASRRCILPLLHRLFRQQAPSSFNDKTISTRVGSMWCIHQGSQGADASLGGSHSHLFFGQHLSTSQRAAGPLFSLSSSSILGNPFGASSARDSGGIPSTSTCSGGTQGLLPILLPGGPPRSSPASTSSHPHCDRRACWNMGTTRTAFSSVSLLRAGGYQGVMLMPTLELQALSNQMRSMGTKKTKIKPYSSYKRRFRLLGSGKFKRWRAGKRHNATSKTPKLRRQLRRPSVVSPGLARPLRMLNFSGRS